MHRTHTVVRTIEGSLYSPSSADTSRIRKRAPLRLHSLFACAAVVLVAATPASTQIAVADFADYQVFQRDIGGTSTSVTVNGASSGSAWDHVDARVVLHGTSTAVVDWATIDNTYGDGNFSGSLRVPQGGWYDIQVRALDAGGAVLSSSNGAHKWGVGMIILTIGQSNMSGNGLPPFTPVASEFAVNFSNAGVWEHLADPYDDDSPPDAVDNDNFVISNWNVGGSMVPSIASSLTATYNFPIAFIPASKGGTDINHDWLRNPANHLDTTSLYGYAATKALRAGGVEMIVIHQGESDALDRRTEAQYKTDFGVLINNYREDLSSAYLPIFACQLGTFDPGVNGCTDPDIMEIRNAVVDLDNGADIYMAATAMDLPRHDQVHYSTSGYEVLGGRVAQAIKYHLGTADYYRGPWISKAFFTDESRREVVVKVVHRGGTDFSPSTGITGFDVQSGGSPTSLASAVRDAADRIRLTLAAPLPADATATLRYLYGQFPDVSGMVKDNTALGLPLEGTRFPIAISAAELPIVSIVADDSTSAEADLNTGRFVLTRDMTQGALTVNLNIGGTAVNGVDYQTIESSVTFAAGQSTAYAYVLPLDDDVSELLETATLALTPGIAYLLDEHSSATVTIADNEPVVPVISVTVSDAGAAEKGSDNGEFTLTRSLPEAAITVHYTLSGTAENGADYALLSGTVTLGAGQAQATIPLQIVNDNAREGNETVTLTLVQDAAYLLAPESSSVSITIKDDDATEFVWNSYAATIRPDAPEARLLDHSRSLPARILVYRSSNLLGVNFGSSLENYRPGAFPFDWVHMAPGYWCGSDYGYDFPFFGKSSVARGADEAEGNTPEPAGVYDLEMHALDNDYLIVAGFVAPLAGEYAISGLGVRRVFWGGATVKLKVFNSKKTLIDEMRATSDRTWATSALTHEVGKLSADDTLYFAVDRDSDRGYDATEITFTVSAVMLGQQPIVAIASPASDVTFDPGVPIPIEVEASDNDGSVAKVEFYADDVKLGEDITAPYTLTWNNAPGGTHVLTARAVDNEGMPGISSPILVSIPLPTVTIAADPAEASEEGPQAGRFTVSRDLTLDPITVSYTVSGSAIAGDDYTTLSGTLGLASGQAVGYVDVMPIDDPAPESDETVIAAITPSATYLTGTPQTATITIHDNEPVWPFVSVTASDAAASETNSDPGEFTFVRTLTAGDVTVYYTLTGPAAIGEDFAFLSGSVTVPDGQAQVTVPVAVVDDALAEGDETVTLSITTHDGYYVGMPNAATVSIADNDVAAFTWQSHAVKIRSELPNAQVTDLSGASTADISFYLSSNDNGVNHGENPFHVAGAHPLGWGLANGYWAWSLVINGADYTMPFCGKSGVARGADAAETNTPAPVDVYDLEVHPPNTEQLSVAAFIAPMTGFYSVTNLGARRISENGAAAQLKLFDKEKALIATLHPTNDRAWVTSPDVYLLGSMQAGDTIYFAADRDDNDDWAYDAVEEVWTVSCQAPLPPFAIAVTSPSSGSSFDEGQVVEIRADVSGDAGLVSKVAFFADGNPIGEDLVAPFETVWTNAGSGSHAITAAAYDAAGVPAIASPVSVSVSPRISIATVTAGGAASEAGPVNGTFTITRTLTDGDLTVSYSVAGTAQNGADYATLSGSVVIPDGQSQAVIPVTIIEDNQAEGDEIAELTIAAGAAYAVGLPNSAALQIGDNDVIDYVWQSYDAQIQPAAPMATIVDRSGASTAGVVFYLSSNDNGVDRGQDPGYYPGSHPLAGLWGLQSSFWAWPYLIGSTDYAIPFCGKNLALRGTENNESTAPMPLNVFDLEVHPPNDERLSVTAFIAPMAGFYAVSNLAARRNCGGGSTSQLKLFGPDKALIDSVGALSDQKWVASPNVYRLGLLSEGDTIFVAVDRGIGEDWSMDATEEAWTVTCQAPKPQLAVVISSPTNGASFSEGDPIAISAVVTSGVAASVAFFADGEKIGDALSGPFEFTWTGAGVGVHSLTAVAADNAGPPTASTPVSITVIQTIPNIALAATDASAAETGLDDGAFTFTRDLTNGDLTIHYTVTGTAQNGVDYTALAGSVVVPDGQASFTIPVQPVDDQAAEGDELVTVTLSGDAAYRIGSAVAATVIIADDDVDSFVWQSFDARMQSGAPCATIADQTGEFTAGLAFFLSANDNGVDHGEAPGYYPGSHPLAGLWGLQSSFWGWPYLIGSTDYAIPFCGKNLAPRGTETNESTAPAPLDVFDLEVHPPNDERLTVTAFVAPISGFYSVSNLAARRNCGGGSTSQLKLFDKSKVLIDSVVALGDQTWARSPNVYRLGFLSAGDTMYVAVDRGAEADWGMDATEEAWTVTCQAPKRHPPVAVDDAAVTTEDDPVTISVLANDSDADGDALTVAGVGAPAHGTAVIRPDNTVTYTPDANFNGNDTFTYAITDGRTTASATVAVSIASVNDGPTVSIVSPLNGATIIKGESVTVEATAGDVDGKVVAVAFFDGWRLIGTEFRAPYLATVKMQSLGAHVLTAVAIDNKGSVTRSVPVRITVARKGKRAPLAAEMTEQDGLGESPR